MLFTQHQNLITDLLINEPPDPLSLTSISLSITETLSTQSLFTETLFQNLLTYPAIASLDLVYRILLLVSFMLVGAALEFTTSWGHEWPCAADLTAIFEYGYLIYYYAATYLETLDSENIVYVALYAGYTIDPIVNMRC